jgi:hypothetical protein
VIRGIAFGDALDSLATRRLQQVWVQRPHAIGIAHRLCHAKHLATRVAPVRLVHAGRTLTGRGALHRRDHEMPVIGALGQKHDIAHGHLPQATRRVSAPHGVRGLGTQGPHVLTSHLIGLTPARCVPPPIKHRWRYPPPASQATMGQFLEDIGQHPRRFDWSLLGVTALPRVACGLSPARSVLTRRTRTRPSRQAPDEQLSTHPHASCFIGHQPLGPAWILPDVSPGQARLLAKPRADRVFRLGRPALRGLPTRLAPYGK